MRVLHGEWWGGGGVTQGVLLAVEALPVSFEVVQQINANVPQNSSLNHANIKCGTDILEDHSIKGR